MAYNGNSKLVSSNQNIEFTAEQIEEYAKCVENADYFIEDRKSTRLNSSH